MFIETISSVEINQGAQGKPRGSGEAWGTKELLPHGKMSALTNFYYVTVEA